MDELSVVQRIIAGFIPLMFAITVHEAAHGWIAYKLGDNTAKQQGRLTLNPGPHIDIFGTVILPIVMIISFSGFIFGWAKPVPVNPGTFKHPKHGMMLVALAGPVANLLMAVAWALLARVGIMFYETEFVSIPLLEMGKMGIYINLVLAVLNLLPIPPLDGSRIVAGILPDFWAWQFYKLERFGFIILIVLLVTGVLDVIMAYPLFNLSKIFFSLAGM